MIATRDDNNEKSQVQSRNGETSAKTRLMIASEEVTGGIELAKPYLGSWAFFSNMLPDSRVVSSASYFNSFADRDQQQF